VTERSLRKAIIAAVAAISVLAFVPSAHAAITTVYGGSLACVPQPTAGNVRVCGGKVPTWDGTTKIDVNVVLPPLPISGPDGPYPLIGDFHGWGGSKIGVDDAQVAGWAQRGYAIFSMSDRGWGNSCGATDPDKISNNADCTNGYNHLLDDRYEVRDAQYLMSVLADEGVIEPQKIGVTGFSYGGGMSMALAALKDRIMNPDGSLSAWTSPGDIPMQIAAAVPRWPWTDLAYSLMPNGRTLDYVADAPYRGPNGDAPIGIEKQSFVAGLYALGLASSNYSNTDPEAALTAWYGLINAGEPYDQNPEAQGIIDQITRFHSSYYIDHSQPPAPLLIQNGWNDDLFPPDEAIRFYNRTITQYPGTPVSLYFMDDGHARSQNKDADEAAFETRENAWFDYYLKGTGTAPTGVESLTTTCGSGSGGPFSADNWFHASPGEIRLDDAAQQTISPSVPSDTNVAHNFDPIAGGGACSTASSADQSGAATYRLPPAPGGGYTLIGAPTIVATIAAATPTSQVAARLEDVDPGTGTETLLARALYRPGTGVQVFQLHPQAYHVAAGHIVKLELLPSDSPYGRVSNGQGPVTVSGLELRLPALEQPGSLNGLVQSPAPKVLPPGYQLAADLLGPGGPGSVSTSDLTGKGKAKLKKGKLRVRGGKLFAPIGCTSKSGCAGNLAVRVAPTRNRRLVRRAGTLIAKGRFLIVGGGNNLVAFPLTGKGRTLVGRVHAFRARVRLRSGGRTQIAVRPVVRTKSHRH
jgi:predicted acyl esterase